MTYLLKTRQRLTAASGKGHHSCLHTAPPLLVWPLGRQESNFCKHSTRRMVVNQTEDNSSEKIEQETKRCVSAIDQFVDHGFSQLSLMTKLVFQPSILNRGLQGPVDLITRTTHAQPLVSDPPSTLSFATCSPLALPHPPTQQLSPASHLFSTFQTCFKFFCLGQLWQIVHT